LQNDERDAFSFALERMGVWYGHCLVTTVALSVLPEADATPVNDRGWTTFEQRVSHLIKKRDLFCWRRFIDAAVPRGDFQTEAYIPVPLHPKDFAVHIAQKVFTNGKTDCEIVAKLYGDTFTGALKEVERLSFESCLWRDKEAKQLAEVLQFCKKAHFISINHNAGIGQAGYDALADAIADGAAPKLQRIHIETKKYSNNLQKACDNRNPNILFFGY